jgi:signal transduction histidine kinase
VLDGVNAALLIAGAAIILFAPGRRLGWAHRLEAAALVAMALMMLHEVLRYFAWVDVESIVMRPYHVPVMLAAIGATIFERHVSAVRQAERTNVELQALVDEKAREMEAYHTERETVLRKQALLDERQRILADMHDGVGASLVGLLRYAQGGQLDPKTVEQRVREAMQELRIAVDALEPAEGDLGAVLGKLRYRLEPLLAAATTRLHWDVAELPRVEALEPSAVLAIQRIVLEAMSNAMQHSGARNIRLAARPRDGSGVEIRIEDDGSGYDAAQAGGGVGLNSMCARAQALGGSVDLASQPGKGTAVTLVIPAALGAARQRLESGESSLSSAARATAAAAE